MGKLQAQLHSQSAQRVGKPGGWFQQRHLDPIRQWTKHWKRQAGL